MGNLMPFDGLFGDSSVSCFFDDVPNFYSQVPPMKVDIEELKDRYEITADMPGFTREQIQISYKNEVLSLAAKKEEQVETEDADRHFIRKERTSTSCERQFVVKGIEEENIKAALKDGILTITLPKKSMEMEKAPKTIEIE